MLCICAEQTFTEVEAYGKEFPPAFETALKAYLAHGLDQIIKGYVDDLNGEEDEMKGAILSIIQDHYLRKSYFLY